MTYVRVCFARSGLCAVVWLMASAVAAKPPIPETERIQEVVDELRLHLTIPEPVLVAVVDENPLLVSVARQSRGSDTFVLQLERTFLADLDDTDLRTVVAHELGHVWIFTHHPFLHTEQLANRIALQLVSDDDLTRVYEKVWTHRRRPQAP